MPAASSLLPWFAPRLSRPMIGVLNNLGHEMHYTRGEVLYESPGFFRPLMLVRRGIVARALMDPLHADPLLVSLSGPRALCGSCETLYVQDRMVRRHWCMTSVDVHVVNADLLLRICDQNPLWQRELSNYSAICALSDRLGMLVTHATSLEERLGVLMIASSLSTDSEFLERFRDPSVEWVPLPVLPSMHVARFFFLPIERRYVEFSSGGYKRIPYVGGRTKFCYLDRDLPLFGIVSNQFYERLQQPNPVSP